MCKQFSLLPIMYQFDYEGFITYTNYWETPESEENPYFLVFNKETYTLFLPKNNDDWLVKTVKTKSVVITKGSYNGKKDCFEVMFMGNKKKLYTIILTDEQFSRETLPKKNCWHGTMYINVGRLHNLIQKHKKIYYRVADTLPCGKPVEDPPGNITA